MKRKLSEYAKAFFGDNFVLRFLIFLLGFTIFIFALATILVSRIGFSTFDTFLQPIRILLGVSDPTKYGTYILMPAGFVFAIVALILGYRRTRTINIDYILAVLPSIFSGFILDQILKIPFWNDMLQSTIDSKQIPFINNPISIVYTLIAAPFFAIGIGLMTISKTMPNCYAILVNEIALKKNKKFATIQLIFDITLVVVGILITIIDIYTKRKDGNNPITWITLLHYIGPGTIYILVIQGFLINYSMVFTKKYIFERFNKKTQ